MDLHLSDAEAQLLRRRLVQDFGNLRMEIASTDSFEYREELKRDEETLRSILERLGVTPATAVGESSAAA